jgi:hypothetical protein
MRGFWIRLMQKWTRGEEESSRVENENQYAFYAFLSRMLGPQAEILDLGTRKGTSAFAFFSGNPHVKITTVDNRRYNFPRLPSNIHYRVEDIEATPQSLINNADLIHLDVSHDGVTEAKFLRRLDNFVGILVMDDVDSDKFPKLRVVWESTGVVFYL